MQPMIDATRARSPVRNAAHARRFGADVAPYPRLLAVEAHVTTLPAFAAALPEAQPDAPSA